MNIIKLFCANTNIKPIIMSEHFLRFLGFYVQKIEYDINLNKINSIVDIYIIDKKYVKTGAQNLNGMIEKKSILILMDGWNYEDDSVRKIFYDNCKSSYDFLKELIDSLSDIILRNKIINSFCINPSWKLSAYKVAEAYINNKLLEASLFTSFYNQKEFFSWGIEQYRRFIEEISEGSLGFLRYVRLLAKYEANLISKMNNYIYRYDTKELLTECDELLIMYRDNKELHLLRTDILFELDDNWMDGCDGYYRVKIDQYSYAYLKRGKILREYYKDYENALTVLKKAHAIDNYNFQVWYQLGKCYDVMGEYNESINAFEKVYDILKYKYKEKSLSPLEWEYLYKSTMDIAIVYKLRLGFYNEAYTYNDKAKEIRAENAIDEYLKNMNYPVENIRYKIYDEFRKRNNMNIHDIY